VKQQILPEQGRCVMTPDPTPPYDAPPEPIITPEDTLRGAGISNERQALYQRRMSSLLARGG
jgi:hypothetical protein